MKKILEFNYPEDESYFVACNAGSDMAFIISDIDTYLRSKLKYEELTQEEQRIYEEVRNKLREFVDERGVSEIIWG